MSRRLSNASDCSAVSSASSQAELWGPEQHERWTSAYGPLTILQEDQVNMDRRPSLESSRRESNDSEYSFSDYSLQFGERKSLNSNLFLYPRDLDRRSSGFSSEYDGNHSRLSFSCDRQSSRLSAELDRRNSSFSNYSDRRSSGYTSDCGDRRDSNYEDRISASSSFVKSPSFSSNAPFVEYGRLEQNTPRISIDANDTQALPEAPTTIKPGMRNVPDWLKLLRLHKYTNLIMNMNYQEMWELTEEKLEKMNVTKGAARKFANSLQKLKERSEILQEINVNVDNGTGEIKKILADLEGILRSPIMIEEETSEEDGNELLLKEPNTDGKLLIEQIVVTLRKVCSYLLLSSNIDPKNGKDIL